MRQSPTRKSRLPLDYVDTSVFLSAILGEEERGRRCHKYLQTIGYRGHPRGVVSHFVVSELFVTLLTRILDEDRHEQEIAQQAAMELAREYLSRLHRAEALTITWLRFSAEDWSVYSATRDIDYSITDDDALHLAMAVRNRCTRFVTTDKGLDDAQMLKQWLRSTFGLRIERLA